MLRQISPLMVFGYHNKNVFEEYLIPLVVTLYPKRQKPLQSRDLKSYEVESAPEITPSPLLGSPSHTFIPPRTVETTNKATATTNQGNPRPTPSIANPADHARQIRGENITSEIVSTVMTMAFSLATWLGKTKDVTKARTDTRTPKPVVKIVQPEL